MRRLIFGFFASIGLLTVLFAIAVGVLLWRLRPAPPSLPDRIVLEVDLTQGLADAPRQSPLLRLVVGGKPSLRDLLDALEAGMADSRVKGLIVHIGGDELGLAKTQEIRDAVAAFRAKGKFAIAFADSFGEFGPGTRPYYLATAFSPIWLQPMGSVGLTGLYTNVPFFKGTLGLLGIVPQFDHREQYKTAMNVLTETQMTLPHREEVHALLTSAAEQIVKGIAAGRKISADQVRRAVDRGPLLAGEAQPLGLVDRIGYWDEAADAARQRAGSDAKLVHVSDYLDAAGHPFDHGDRIALIYGSGLIVGSSGDGNPLVGADLMAADHITRAFYAAVRDPKVRAILFRIDSPGGSVAASETIWRDVVYAQRHGKPVIVSMGDVAGSGGYYVAAAADKIVAEPATLTGSIGVLAGKFAVSEFLKKLGVTTDSEQIGANAAMFSATSEFSERAHARLEAFLDASYQGFKQHVAKGRHMSAAAVEAVAKGRVWTGEEAKARGLVDALGGYATALRLAREVAKIPADAPLELTQFPRPKGPAELLYDRLTGKGNGDRGVGAIGRAIEMLGPLAQRIEMLATAPAVLMMPPISPPR